MSVLCQSVRLSRSQLRSDFMIEKAFKGYRSNVELVISILRETRKPIKITNLMRHCKMSWEGLNQYLEILISKHLVTQINDLDQNRSFLVTEKGRDAIEIWEKLSDLLSIEQEA